MPRLTRDEKKAETRAALVRSAADVIARRGFHAASVDEIAESAGFSVGAVYSSFGRKEDLLLAAAEQNVADWAELFALRFRDGATLTEQGRNVAHAWIEGVTERPEPFLLWVELWAHAVRNGPPLSDELARRSRPIRDTFTAILADAAQRAGVALSPTVAEELGTLFDALGLGFAMRRLLDPEAVPAGLFEDVTGRVLDGLFRALA